MRALLDVNVLIALLDADHVHLAASHAWLEANIDAGWASCPLTQNGCIRIMSQPSYPGTLSAAAVAQRLAAATQTQWHSFWPDGLSLLDAGVLDWT
ncbi:MAG: VapC toxin family PIN domain ribonuclease, partial [Gammaproteobacteria bacterium]|nr:VapC toxin family PIN domain ribonuclease [Gammaproteobacteria bacterium]